MSEISRLETIDDIALCDDSAALLDSLRDCASNLLKNLSRMAAILRRLDELGVEVTIDHALLPYVRMIAQGKLSASCFLTCSGDSQLLQLATRLSLPVQEQIAANEPFKVLEKDGGHRMVRPLEMGRREMNQVFSHGNVRNDLQQRAWLKASENKSLATSARMSGSITEKRDMSIRLPSKPGERCPECGAKLLDGAECVACVLKNKEKLAAAKREEMRFARYSKGHEESEVADDPNDESELPEGWQDRWAQLRQLKSDGGEVRFHVEWLMAYLRQPDGYCDEHQQLLDELAEQLERFESTRRQKVG